MAKCVFLVVLLCLFCTLVPPSTCANVSELSWFGWMFIKDVLMLDVARYNVSVRTLEAPTAFGAPPNQVYLTYDFKNAENELSVNFLFKEGRFASCILSSVRGDLLFVGEKPATYVEWAMAMLERYQRLSGKDYIEHMLDMLSQAKMNGLGSVRASDVYPSYTAAHWSGAKLPGFIQTMGNIKMSIFVESNEPDPEKNNATYIQWEYVENGVTFRQKSVGFILFPRNIHFYDQWELYRVGSSRLKFSTEEAVRVAKEAVKDLTYMSDGKPVGNLTVLEKPLYVYIGTDYRGSDYYTLYPYWEVYLCLEKMYPAGVTGVRVFIWADTGEVFKRELSGGYGGGGEPAPPAQETNPQTNQGAIITGIAAAATFTATAIITIKRRLKHKTTIN